MFLCLSIPTVECAAQACNNKEATEIETTGGYDLCFCLPSHSQEVDSLYQSEQLQQHPIVAMVTALDIIRVKQLNQNQVDAVFSAFVDGIVECI